MNFQYKTISTKDETCYAGQSRYDKKTIIRALVVVLFVGILITLMMPNALSLCLYFMLYVMLGILTFYMSINWLSALTVFYALFTYVIGLGEFIVWIEGMQIRYSPFVVVIGGYACLLLGYILSSQIKNVEFSHIIKIRFNFFIKWSHILYATFAISFLAGVYYFISNRQILISNLNSGRIEAMSGNGVIVYIAKLHILTIPYLYTEWRKKRIDTAVFVFLAVVGELQLLLMGFRTPAATVIIIILVLCIFEGRIKLKKVIPILVILLVAIIAYGVIRNGTNASSIYTILRSQFYPNVWNLNQIFRVFPDNVSFQNGYTYIIDLKMLLPGEDPDFTLWLKDAIGANYSGGGLTPTILGEFYLNFGYTGIYIGMVIMGIILNRVDRWVLRGNITVWKAYIIFELAYSCRNGLGGVYLGPLIYGIFFGLLKMVSNSSD